MPFPLFIAGATIQDKPFIWCAGKHYSAIRGEFVTTRHIGQVNLLGRVVEEGQLLNQKRCWLESTLGIPRQTSATNFPSILGIVFPLRLADLLRWSVHWKD
jgi:hypothetical protein